MPPIELAPLPALGRYPEAETCLQPLTAEEQIDPVKDRAREALILTEEKARANAAEAELAPLRKEIARLRNGRS